MKKIFNILAVAFFVIFAGYNVQKVQKAEVMSDIAMENVEALAQTENPNSTITGDCLEALILTTDCEVVCPVCNTIWTPEIPLPKKVARNVSGICGLCGNTSWIQYNYY